MLNFDQQLTAVTAERRKTFERHKQRQEFEKKCEAEKKQSADEAFMLYVYNVGKAAHPEMTDAQFRAFEIKRFHAGAIDHYDVARRSRDQPRLPVQKRSMEDVGDNASCGKFCSGPEDFIWIRCSRPYLNFLEHYDNAARCAFYLPY